MKTAWIDVSKAYDNIDHQYLIQILKAIKAPEAVIKFVEVVAINLKISIFYDGNMISNVNVKKGII